MCHGDTERIKMILFIIIITCILLVLSAYGISNRITYKELCKLEENEEMSIESKLEKMKIYALGTLHCPPSFAVLKNMMTYYASIKSKQA